MWNFQWQYIYVLLIYNTVPHFVANWPLLNSSGVQLAGIFYEDSNTTESTSWSRQCRAMFQSAIVLAQKYNITVDGQFIGWQTIRSDGNSINTLSSTCRLVPNSNIVGVVGPPFSRESHFMAPFAAQLRIPMVSYASTDPDLSDRQTNPSFYRTLPADTAAALAIAKLFDLYNWTSCIIIYQNDAFGLGGTKAISDTFEKNNLTVAEMIVFDTMTRSIKGDLRALLMSSSTRLVILWADSGYSATILELALRADVLGPQFMWILSTNIPLNSFLPTWREQLSGMLTLEPVVGDLAYGLINKTLLNEAYEIWKTYEPGSFPESKNVDYYALFAFDATWTLIQALHHLCSTTTPCVSLFNSLYCFDRQLINSSSLFDIIDSNTFLGVSGPIAFSANTTDRANGTYYIVKNVQSSSNILSYVPVLVSSETGEWTANGRMSSIIWPGKSTVPPTGYASISGLVLRIAVIEAVPFTKCTAITDGYGRATQKIVGYIPDLIKQLEKAMGFISNITCLPSNQSYNALINAVANGDYDMVVGDVTIYADRRKLVTFSAGIFDNSLRIITRITPIEPVNYWSFLRPFSCHLWIIIICVIVWSAILIFLFECRRNRTMKRKSLIHQFELSMYYAFGTLVGYNWDYRIRTLMSRLVTAAIYILSFVLVAQYQANLTSDLTVAKTNNIISGIEDLKNGKAAPGRIGIRTNTAIETFYLREVSGGSRDFYPLRTKGETFQKLLTNVIDVALMDSGVSEYFVGNVYCNLTLVGAPADYSQFGIVTQKNWIYQQVLDVNILSLRESGVLDSLKTKWFQTSYCSNTSSILVDQLSIGTMAGVFIIFGSISILALLLFMCQYMVVVKCHFSGLVKKCIYSIRRTVQPSTKRDILRTPALYSIPRSSSNSSIASHNTKF
ncbi:unnamed protein product [Adineta ricciae]|uniref:Ionotropic glutamate receptor C-terminal domain-containing protein n=1 Tax=Adineta ricciae TaxID=249248 RepID=A0A814HD34_ADIRI|nr:unnamed protein product [Adineta ricciae]